MPKKRNRRAEKSGKDSAPSADAYTADIATQLASLNHLPPARIADAMLNAATTFGICEQETGEQIRKTFPNANEDQIRELVADAEVDYRESIETAERFAAMQEFSTILGEMEEHREEMEKLPEAGELKTECWFLARLRRSTRDAQCIAEDLPDCPPIRYALVRYIGETYRELRRRDYDDFPPEPLTPMAPDEFVAHMDKLALYCRQKIEDAAKGEAEFQPAEWFKLNTTINNDSLRTALKEKKIRAQKRGGGANYYSVADAKRIWPQKFNPVTA